MSFKSGNDFFITFEMPGVAYSRPVDKIHISLQFRPSVIKGPCLSLMCSIPSAMPFNVAFFLYSSQ